MLFVLHVCSVCSACFFFEFTNSNVCFLKFFFVSYKTKNMAESSHHCGKSSMNLLPRLSTKCDPNDCPRGDPGFRGPRGDTGEQGLTGNDGETGPQGPPGEDSDSVGLSYYAEYYSRMLANATVVISKDERVYFRTVGVSPTGTIARGDDDSKFVLASGYYRISWRVPTSSPGALRLNVGGVGLLRTTTGSNHSCEITNTVLLVVQYDGAVIFIENPGDEFEVPASSDGEVSLTHNIVIVFIGPYQDL